MSAPPQPARPVGPGRYLVFAYYTYYPSGGWNDFQKSFDNLAEAVVFARGLPEDEWGIIDRETLEEIA